MISLNYMFEKKVLSENKKSEMLLLSLAGIKSAEDERKKLDRKKLNVCLCIDISGSMDETISGRGALDFFNPLIAGNLAGHFQLQKQSKAETPSKKTKLSLVKSAAIKSLDSMLDGDIISIVKFDNQADVVVEAQEITKSNRIDIIEKINSLYSRGATNLHGGWVASVEQVAKNISKDNLNRVIMLTDGEINNGERDVDTICNDVSKLSMKNLSTSTFGVGQGFNEELLSAMADSGKGNFYFISNEKEFDTLFSEEFTGISTVCATEVYVKFNLGKDVLESVLTEIKMENGVYALQDFTTNTKMPIMLKIDTSKLSKGINNLGEIELSFKDVNGVAHKLKEEIKIDLVTGDEWEKEPDQDEFKIQELLYIIAQSKLKARKLFEAGDRTGASNILRASSASILGANINDSRLSAQSASLDQTLSMAETETVEGLSKKMYYESYRSFKGKDL